MCKKAISIIVLPHTCTAEQFYIGFSKVYKCSALSIAIRELLVLEDTLADISGSITPSGPVGTAVNCNH